MRREIMSTTKRKPSMTAYQRYEYKQLATIIRNWYKKYTKLAKTPAWKTTKGWTPAQQRVAFKREIARATFVLRNKLLKEIDLKIKTLKTQAAKFYCVSVNSPKCNTATVRRLNAKRRQISSTANVPAFIKVVTALKLASYKHPASFNSTSYKKTTVSKKKKKTKNTGYRTASVLSLTKYRKQTKTLKKEIQKLKTRNSFMKSQVAKFRKEAAQLQRHYGSFNNQAPTKLRVITASQLNKDVSNIIRFSNALNNAVQKQRKVG